MTVGYCVILLVVGCIREWLASGTVFGVAVDGQCGPAACGLHAGGRIHPAGGAQRRLAGPGCPVRAFLANEARNQVIVNHQKEARRESWNTVMITQPGSVQEALTIFLGYAFMAILAQNAVFTRALGVSRLVQLVGDERTNSVLFGILQCQSPSICWQPWPGMWEARRGPWA